MPDINSKGKPQEIGDQGQTSPSDHTKDTDGPKLDSSVVLNLENLTKIDEKF